MPFCKHLARDCTPGFFRAEVGYADGIVESALLRHRPTFSAHRCPEKISLVALFSCGTRVEHHVPETQFPCRLDEVVLLDLQNILGRANTSNWREQPERRQAPRVA